MEKRIYIWNRRNTPKGRFNHHFIIGCFNEIFHLRRKLWHMRWTKYLIIDSLMLFGVICYFTIQQRISIILDWGFVSCFVVLPYYFIYTNKNIYLFSFLFDVFVRNILFEKETYTWFFMKIIYKLKYINMRSCYICLNIMYRILTTL